MNKQDFIRELVGALHLEPHNLTGGEMLNGLNGWDSMAAIEFITLADTLFAVSVSAGQLAKCNTVDDLATLFGDQITT